MSRRIVVVTAGLTVPSSTRLLADQLATASVAALRAAGEDAQLEVVELRDLAHPIADNLLTGFPSGALADAVAAVAAADAVIAVTPVFSASYSGLFKSFFDVLDVGALDGTPVLLAATAGTARHSLVLEHALRPLFAYLRAVVVPTGVLAATDDFAGTDLDARILRAARELVLLVEGATGAAAPRPVKRRTVDDELADPTPFAELLARAGRS